jgi:hypothetical protein
MHSLLDALARGDDARQAAEAAGLDPKSLEQLTLLTRVLEVRERRKAKRARLMWGGLASMAVATGVLFSAAPALAQVTCTQTLPAPLVTFCPDAPAQAAQVNGNFQQLVTWVQQKVGPVGNGNISTGAITATGAVGAAGNVTSSAAMTATGDITTSGRFIGPRANLSAGTIQRGGNNITATSDLGLYSRVNANWLRFVTNGGAMKFFNSEGTDGIGGALSFSVENDGSLTSNFAEPENTQLLPPSFCVVVPINSGCPANWDQRQVKWDTEDDSNADSGKDGRIASDNGNSGSVLMRFCCRGW